VKRSDGTWECSRDLRRNPVTETSEPDQVAGRLTKGRGLSTGVIKTASGSVRGAADSDGVWSFKGVPYGDDTGGPGRFRPARPPQPWSGVRDCLTYGPSCPQMTIEQMTGTPMPVEIEQMMGVLGTEPSMSEDCLVLNVWTPTLEAEAALPVLVWLHGGGMNTGSASWPLYDFSNLANHGKVVIVGINHRLGILGFLDLSTFGEDFADSGNVGMLDVVDALQWVRQNIRGFGGDPKNVTVFGESGGGAKTSTLLAMPAANGLFHKAFPMSGMMLAAQRPEVARSTAEMVLEQLGVGTDRKKLEAVDVSRLVETELALQGAQLLGGGGRRFGPVLGPSLPEHPEQALRAGASAGIPVVSGCTTDEMLAFLAADPELWTLTEQGLRDRLGLLLGEHTDPIIAGYRSIRPDDSPMSLLVATLTDATMRVPHIRFTEARLQAGGAPVWMYLFAWGQPDDSGRRWCAHGSDMPYFFDNVHKAPMAAGTHSDELVAAMSGALVAFAYTGNPNHGGLPKWPTYKLDDRSTMMFDTPSSISSNPFGAEYLLWQDVPLRELRTGG
jgi:para-nitrobenzyl esterase